MIVMIILVALIEGYPLAGLIRQLVGENQIESLQPFVLPGIRISLLTDQANPLTQFSFKRIPDLTVGTTHPLSRVNFDIAAPVILIDQQRAFVADHV